MWRATDSRLGREVAIKVLPAGVAGDAKALARFESEARAVAALSHPNILGIHELGRAGDTLFAVTELLDGETLRERIDRDGALGLRATLDIGAQVARGLAAAHEKGIVHRDVKPANLFLLPDGRVKILDFIWPAADLRPARGLAGGGRRPTGSAPAPRSGRFPSPSRSGGSNWAAGRRRGSCRAGPKSVRHRVSIGALDRRPGPIVAARSP